MLLALMLFACPPQTETERLEVLTETLSDTGTYGLAITMDPDPPTVGEQDLVLALTRTEVAGALVTGATLTGTLTAPEDLSISAITADFTEDPAGSYTANWRWTASGYWELDIVIGDPQQDETARFAFVVDPAL